MHKKFCLQYVCCFILLLSAYTSNAQNDTIVKYYDSSWRPVPKDSAMFFTQFVKKDSFYQSTSYWIHSMKLNCQSNYMDTFFKNRIGAFHQYYENGQTDDSAYYPKPWKASFYYHYYKSGQLASSYFYDKDGKLLSAYRYYENGKLNAHYSHDPVSGKETTEGYDENGNKIDGFIYEREADFPDGIDGWKHYLQRKLNAQIPIDNGAPKGVYTVIVQFIVDKDGNILEANALTHFGYGMEEEAIRVIKASPKWLPAIQNNRFVNSYRRQPITFVVGKL